MMMENILYEYMREHHYGYQHAATKDTILQGLYADKGVTIPERVFRRILSEFKHDGHNGVFAYSLHTSGYWIGNEYGDNAELEHQVRSWQEMKSRAMSMLTDAERRIKVITDKINQKADLFV